MIRQLSMFYIPVVQMLHTANAPYFSKLVIVKYDKFLMTFLIEQ